MTGVTRILQGRGRDSFLRFYDRAMLLGPYKDVKILLGFQDCTRILIRVCTDCIKSSPRLAYDSSRISLGLKEYVNMIITRFF